MTEDDKMRLAKETGLPIHDSWPTFFDRFPCFGVTEYGLRLCFRHWVVKGEPIIAHDFNSMEDIHRLLDPPGSKNSEMTDSEVVHFIEGSAIEGDLLGASTPQSLYARLEANEHMDGIAKIAQSDPAFRKYCLARLAALVAENPEPVCLFPMRFQIAIYLHLLRSIRAEFSEYEGCVESALRGARPEWGCVKGLCQMYWDEIVKERLGTTSAR